MLLRLITIVADLCGGVHLAEGFFCVVLPEQIGNGFTELALSMGWRLFIADRM